MTDKLTSIDRSRLVLASASPRRAELLAAAGFRPRVLPAHIDESLRPGEAPAEYVQRLSREKALAVSDRVTLDDLVLGADTVVLIGSEIAGKPVDEADATRMLRALSDRWHEVLTGVTCLLRGQSRSEVVVTRVRFAALGNEEIDWYVASGEPFDKAGAYAIQGLASLFIEEIQGSYSNVVGLPVQAVYRLATELGSDVLSHFANPEGTL